MKALLYGVGALMFFMAMAISYYVIFGIVIVAAAFVVGKIAQVGHEEYQQAQKEQK